MAGLKLGTGQLPDQTQQRLALLIRPNKAGCSTPEACAASHLALQWACASLP